MTNVHDQNILFWWVPNLLYSEYEFIIIWVLTIVHGLFI